METKNVSGVQSFLFTKFNCSGTAAFFKTK